MSTASNNLSYHVKGMERINCQKCKSGRRMKRKKEKSRIRKSVFCERKRSMKLNKACNWAYYLSPTYINIKCEFTYIATEIKYIYTLSLNTLRFTWKKKKKKKEMRKDQKSFERIF